MTAQGQASCLFIGVTPTHLINFRGTLIKAMLAKGMKVYAASNPGDTDTEAKLRSLGVQYCPVNISKTGMAPLADLRTLIDLIRLIRHIKPDMVFCYMIKPVIYGGLAARSCGVHQIFSMIEGLGYVFMPWENLQHAYSSFVARGLYRIGLLCSTKVFFLNQDDLDQFVDGGYVPRQKAVLLNGIGVDLAHYPIMPLPSLRRLRFILIARLIKDKGIREYVQAARILKARQRPADFLLVGDVDENPNSIKRDELDAWRREGIVDCSGWVADVRAHIQSSHVFILPSYYREGVPRTTLEAMSMGRAVITSDGPGCRETVDLSRYIPLPAGMLGSGLKIGSNGILVPPKDVNALVVAMEFFLDHPDQVDAMGKEGRAYAQRRYDVDKVNAVILKEMGDL